MWEAVGIPETQARVYEALIAHRESTTETLAVSTALTTAKVAGAVRELIARGLVKRVGGRPARYDALAPELAGSVLIARQEHALARLQQHLNRLDQTYHEVSPDQKAVVERVEGAARVWRAFVRIQRAATVEIQAFDKPPYFVPPGEHGDEGPNLDERRLLEAGKVGYRVVYDQESVALPGRLDNIWEGVRRGERARVAVSLPAKLVIADDEQAIMCSVADYHAEVAYLVRRSVVLDLVRNAFEAAWERAVPLNRTASDDAAPLSARDRQLLGLLATGATDEVIARTFGWSIRTVQRHVHDLMRAVGARTRFQVGMEAVRRGWL